jgi:putative hemolysin
MDVRTNSGKRNRSFTTFSRWIRQSPGMNPGQLSIDVPSASSFLPRPVGTLLRPFDPQLKRFFLPDELLGSLRRASGLQSRACADALLSDFGIGYHLPPGDLARIPPTGPAVVVCNHPFGFLEGLVLLSALPAVRKDFRIVVNSVLATVKPLAEHFIFVNPFAGKDPHQNAIGVRRCYEWLRSGGLLIVFPAGEVAHLNWEEHAIADPKWNETAARLARKVNCPAVPMFFDGSNSIRFQMAGTIHPGLRTLNLPRELMNKRSRTLRAATGSAIPGHALRAFDSDEAATDYLRARVYLLSSRKNDTFPLRTRILPPAFMLRKQQPVSGQSRTEEVACDVSALGPDALLAAGDEFEVYVASADRIPNALLEIGRSRETTFREVGEGSNRSIDLDRFDAHYQHLFLWHTRHRQIAGAYRIAATPDVLPKYGVKGLYTSTLFQYAPQFFDKIGNAFELGRSFIRQEYQRHYAPLLLLWKGIAKCVERRPECPVLFGAVSISSGYHPLSRALIMNFLNGHVSRGLAEHVMPRRSYRRPLVVPKHIRNLNSLLHTLEELSAAVSDLEFDGKGVPVLLRQYLKLGGRFAGFNVDASFSNTLDGLIFADLRTAPGPILDRCMGRAGAAAFRAWHSPSAVKLTL